MCDTRRVKTKTTPMTTTPNVYNLTPSMYGWQNVAAYDYLYRAAYVAAFSDLGYLDISRED